MFIDSKWKIISEIANSPCSPTDLALKTGTTVANISSQLKLLEALDFISQEKLSNIGKGEPRKLYSIKKEFAYLIISTRSAVGKKMIRLDEKTIPFFSVWLLPDQSVQQILIKFYLEYEGLLSDAVSLGYLGIKDNELELLLIHETPQNAYFLNERNITRLEKTYKLKVHINTKEEFNRGLKNNEPYFTSSLKKVFLLLDKEDYQTKLKKGGA